MFVPYVARKTPVLQRQEHNCHTSYLREFCIVDVKGVQHKANLRFCSCEEESVTVIRYGLWPASPSRPRVAFQLEMMEMAPALQLEGGLATKSFCDGLKFVKKFQIHDVQEVKNLYRVLVGDCSNEYRFHRTVFDSGKHLDMEYACCPACTNTCKNVSVDANFGLVHKKGSGLGQGLEGVRHQSSFFLDQKDVDTFVDAYKNPKANKDCSSFQAGNVLRSKIKNDKLDVTGLFGSVCKHDYPLKFCNLRHGERLAYAVYYLEKIEFGNLTEKRIFMYDIACLLYKHLKLNGKDDILSNNTFAVPVFHSYAHNIQCQLQFGQKNVEGTGLADGEGTERLWSYLRTMSKMTKEMSLDNRHDMIVDSLHHYTSRLQLTLAERIVNRFKKAVALKEATLEYFMKLENSSEIASMDDVKKLHEERKISILQPRVSGTISCDDKEEYCWLLKQYMEIRQKLTGVVNSESHMVLNSDLESVEKKLLKKAWD